MSHCALITGGSSGIGWATAQAMLAKGWQVVSLAQEAPPETAPGLYTEIADLADPAATAAAAARITAAHDISHIIHNAGQILPALVEDADPASITRLAQLHLATPLALTQAALPGMKARGFGRILFTGSRAALGVPTRTAYAATKAGIIGMARTWALELAPHGITVNVVSPGPIRTRNFWDIVPEGSAAETALAARIPVGRLGEPADVARALMFLADADAGFITGQVLMVCGGASIGTISL